MPAAVPSGIELDETSDAVDHGPPSRLLSAILLTYIFILVNVLKGKLWDDRSEFDKGKDKTQFRQYQDACDRVKSFYKEQHGMVRIFGHCQTHGVETFSKLEKQTLKFNIDVRVKSKNRKKVRMSVWQAIEMLNTLVDDSDPDV